MHFFDQSVEKIKKIADKHEKWYGMLMMLSNHTPFSELDKYGDFPVDIKETITNEDGQQEDVTYPYMEGTKLEIISNQLIMQTELSVN